MHPRHAVFGIVDDEPSLGVRVEVAHTRRARVEAVDEHAQAAPERAGRHRQHPRGGLRVDERDRIGRGGCVGIRRSGGRTQRRQRADGRLDEREGSEPFERATPQLGQIARGRDGDVCEVTRAVRSELHPQRYLDEHRLLGGALRVGARQVGVDPGAFGSESESGGDPFGEVRVALVGEHARGHERVEHEPHRSFRADRLDAFHTTHVTRGFRHSGRLRTRAIGPRRPPLRP